MDVSRIGIVRDVYCLAYVVSGERSGTSETFLGVYLHGLDSSPRKGDFVDETILKKYIPMTETTYYTLLSVLEPRHGYAIMQYVHELTKERITLGTGTLYTMVGRLVNDGIIDVVPNVEGKKAYQITAIGMELLQDETRRLREQLEDGESVLAERSTHE